MLRIVQLAKCASRVLLQLYNAVLQDCFQSLPGMFWQRVLLTIGLPCGGGLTCNVLLGKLSEIRWRPVNIQTKSEDALNLLDKLVELFLMPNKINGWLYGCSLDWQHCKLSDNLR